MEFEWDENKRLSNLQKHGLDFAFAVQIWKGLVWECISPQLQHGEERWVAVGELSGVVVSVIFTWRDENRRIISARKARIHEREDYENVLRRSTFN